jgi:hypothetical protein
MDESEISEYEELIHSVYIANNDFEREKSQELSDSQLEAFQLCRTAVENHKKRVEQHADPHFMRKNVPLDSYGNSLVLYLDIEVPSIKTLISDIRKSLYYHMESTSEVRILSAKTLNTKRKTELTEELEDLLRTHWPRSGLVETQIKRPREVELLNHEEKTYRFILSIQEKVNLLLSKFENGLEITENCYKKYIDDLKGLENVLTTTPFKTLTALQGLEVKARSLTQTFQSAGVTHISSLRQMHNEDILNIISYSRDFRKFCPPQEDGKEGGYSPSELTEIAELVEGQCTEIQQLAEEWKVTVNTLEHELANVLKAHEAFGKLYEGVANEVALSQGLGQKYGAPRRRAQERIRTEVSRDEKSAGKVDELLAKLEFECSEAIARFEAKGSDDKMDTSKADGMFEVRNANEMWKLAMQIRQALHQRTEYLDVFGDDADKNLTDIAWPDIISKFPSAAPQDITSTVGQSGSINETTSPREATKSVESQSLSKVIADVDAVCRLETKQLYEQEKKLDLLAGTEGGVPESLQLWLKESHHKVLGSGGHRERAWKKLWSQVDKFETLLARKTGPMDQPQIKVGVPAACFRTLGLGYILFTSQMVTKKVEQFSKLLKLWEKGKEKHERHLRPRLGSPDAVDELSALDNIETERSNELKSSVLKFQSNLIMNIAQYSKLFCEDLGACAKSYLLMLDNSLHLDFVQVPPDTEIPKKKITLKRLRKAQRIKEEVKNGKEDQSIEREWPCLPVMDIVTELRVAEPLLLESDLRLMYPVQEPDPATAVGAKKAPAAKVKKTESTDTAGAPPAVPPMIPDAWIEKVKSESTVRALVTTAHRLIISERDAALLSYTRHIKAIIEENKIYYQNILQQEDSWNQRWRSQVNMLRQGDL